MQQTFRALQSTGTAEAAFLAVESKALCLQAAVKAFASEVRRFVASAQTGNLANLSKAQHALDQKFADLAEASSAVQASDIEAIRRCIGSPEFVQEVLDAASELGLKDLRVSRNAILSHPHRVVFDSASGYRLGYRSSAELRPTVIAKTLKGERERSRSLPSNYLDSLRATYLLLSRGQSGISVPLSDLYNALTILPAMKRTYPEADFIRDIGLLDEAGPKTTKDGFRVSFPASTSARSNRGYATVNAGGHEVPYASIRFDPS